MERLKKRVAAARAELELLELQDALNLAELGQVEPLQQWLQARRSDDPRREGMATNDESSPQDHAVGADAAGDGGEDVPFPLKSWEAIVPHAQARVAAARAEERQRPPTSNAADAPVDLDLLRSAEAHRRLQSRVRIRGAIASGVAHVLLLLLLAFVTLRTPPPPAGMSFESATPVEEKLDTVELTEPVEADPSEAIPEQTMEPLVDVSDALDSSLPVQDVLGELATPSTSELDASVLSTAAEVVGAATSAEFFGAAAGGNAFCYVIDGSASMRGGPWEAARAELLSSLASLKPHQRFYIIFYNRQLQAIPDPAGEGPARHLLYATPENLQHARRWLQSLKIDTGAPPNDALELAISLEPDAIYLLTDGVTSVDVAGFLREVNRSEDLIYGTQIRVPIHTIAFYSLDGQQLLRRIAAENGGQFVYVPDPRRRR